MLLVGASPIPVHHPRAAATTAPNIVLILTDDQRWDTLWAMPNVQSELVAHGIDFTNAFVVNSLCCPSRASILTGEYSHSTMVYDDGGPYGGFQAFRDAETTATWLHAAGYHTGLIGKYLNRYMRENETYIPPGWDRWFGALLSRTNNESAYYYDYYMSDQGVESYFGYGDANYSTDVYAAQADSFIRTTDADQPLFLYLAPAAPHEPATPPTRYATEFSELPPSRPPNFNERDVSDKPSYIRKLRHLTKAQQAAIDALRINQYRTLLGADDAVGTVVKALSDTGRLDNTMIVFASDNGLTWGEHRNRGKIVPYEESIRVPLVIRYDPLVAIPSTDDHLVTNLDLASTFTELAGAQGVGLEGLSLIPLLAKTPVAWRNDFLVEHLRGTAVVPTYCAVRNEGFIYITYDTAEEELYDLASDPYELVNVASDPAYASTVASLRVRLQTLCDPPPPGFTFPYDALAPSQPTALSGTAPSSTEVDLTWSPSTDNVAVTGYTIYRDGATLATVDGTTLSYADATVEPGTTYTYTVDAFDAAGNHSVVSDPFVITTPQQPDRTSYRPNAFSVSSA
jgi:N-acetylglucosamine-6-sulfatase